MTRVTRGFVAKKRRKKVLKLASGFTGANHRLFRTAQQRVLRALALAYRDRRLYKRKIRGVWIRRMNSFLRGYSCSLCSTSQRQRHTQVKPQSGAPKDLNHRNSKDVNQTNLQVVKTLEGNKLNKRPLNYSIFLGKLKNFNILLNRKILSQLSIFDPLSMEQIVHHVL